MMTLKTLAFSVFSFILGASFFAATTPVRSFVSSDVSTSRDDRRAPDCEAIRAHLDKIFRAFINKDLPTIRATHVASWIGFTVGARSIIRGIDEYMQDAKEIQGKTSRQSGRATEIYVHRNGAWVNPGWHMDSGK